MVLNVLTFVGAVWLMATGEHGSAAKRFYDMNTDDYYDRDGADDYYDDEQFTFAYTKETFNNWCDENRKTRESDLSDDRDDDYNDGCSETGGWALILGLVCTIFSTVTSAKGKHIRSVCRLPPLTQNPCAAPQGNQ